MYYIWGLWTKNNFKYALSSNLNKFTEERIDRKESKTIKNINRTYQQKNSSLRTQIYLLGIQLIYSYQQSIKISFLATKEFFLKN